MFETSSFNPPNSFALGGSPDVTHFIKRSLDLVGYPGRETDGASPATSLLAFDFAHAQCLLEGESVLCLRQDRSVEAIDVASAARSIRQAGFSASTLVRLDGKTSNSLARDDDVRRHR